MPVRAEDPANRARELSTNQAANRPASSGRTTGTAIKTGIRLVRELTVKVTQNAAANGRKAKGRVRRTAMVTDRGAIVRTDCALKTGNRRWQANCW